MRDSRIAPALGAALVALAALGWVLGRGLYLPGGLGWPEYFLLAALGLSLICMATVYVVQVRQRRRLDRLRGALVIAGGLGTPLPPLPGGPADGVDRLQQAVADLIGRERDRRGLLDRRLEAVLSAIDDAIVVVTAHGQVSLLNAAGKARLGEQCGLGSSLFEIFERESLALALTQAGAAGPAQRIMLRAVDGHEIETSIAGLGPGGGALMRFAAGGNAQDRLLEHDLTLHDLLPEDAPATDGTLLDDLAAVSLDTETTGLNVRRDRMLSVAAVPLQGARVYRAVTFDRLVNPGLRIPPGSTAVHSITNAMIDEAPPFHAIAEDLASFCGARVWIGHNIGFDIAILRREAKLASIPWREPVGLDTLRLYAALRPSAPDIELDAVATDLGVGISGRHTALGDALMTAEVYRRLLPLLAEAGVRTLGEALAFAERPRLILRLQRSLGW
jgi:DNA polymerase III subunit epsilon